MTISSSLSFIEPHEEALAQEFIEKHLGFKAPPSIRNFLTVKIHTRPEEITTFIDPISGQHKSIYLPASISASDKFVNCTALVISMGPEAYTDEQFNVSGPWCKVGDWIVIPRNEGTQINYRGIPMQVIRDNVPVWIIEDPEWVVRD